MTRLGVEREQGNREPSERKRGLFPYYPLNQALRVPSAIKAENAGKPMNRILLAKALDLSPGSSTFRLLVTSSNLYGLTAGNPYKGETISLDELGLEIVSPRSEEEKKAALLKATITPELLGRFYREFDNNKIPRPDLAQNKLERDYHVPAKQSEKCFDLIMDNAKMVGILQEVQGNQYIMMDSISAPSKPHEVSELEESSEVRKPEDTPLSVPPSSHPAGVEAVFIAHGKNNRLLTQVRQVVEFGRFVPVIAEETHTTAIPVPEKVISDMHNCQAAIIIVSADEKVTREDGQEHYKINDNVLIEIGAATVLYRKKVILLWDKRIPIPSNLQGLYRCEFEGDSLDWEAGMKLQKDLTEFRQ